jgi:hypothetical protein
LIWSPIKNCNSPIIDISNSLLMSSSNLTTKEWDEPPKLISSTYTWTIRISSFCLRRKSLIYFAHLKPVAEQESPQTTIPSTGTLLKPIQRLPQPIHSMGKLNTLKARWLLKASRPLIHVLVINDNHYGLTFLFEL